MSHGPTSPITFLPHVALCGSAQTVYCLGDQSQIRNPQAHTQTQMYADSQRLPYCKFVSTESSSDFLFVNCLSGLSALKLPFKDPARSRDVCPTSLSHSYQASVGFFLTMPQRSTSKIAHRTVPPLNFFYNFNINFPLPPPRKRSTDNLNGCGRSLPWIG